MEEITRTKQIIKFQAKGFICEKGTRCKWKCFALNSDGFSFGEIPVSTSNSWREWHDKECGGRLIPLEIKEI